ncbi:MAG: DUF4258 domain-containing protein [Hyphomicrobiaceae bacterium]
MPRLTLTLLRALVRRLEYVVSLHAAEELEDDDLTILDLESILITGRIVERQHDRITGETKCLVEGITVNGLSAAAVVKLGHNGRLFVVTVWLD